ncbi:restriction endonuclease [Streptomyces sp. NPDC002884]|uniref:restriction endonuclease n=1 Tax=Streptomyces sp. NPDC002884 TaxID=3154544 RepID=UPI00332AF7F9
MTSKNPRLVTSAAPPARRQIQSWQDAEHNAAAWMRHWGFSDAQAKPGGADGGIDVRSRRALGQVKYQAAAVGRPELQNLFGARGRDMHKQLFFFTGSSYATTAVAYADTNDIALFVYALDGAMTPVNKVARRLGRPPAPITPQTPPRLLPLTSVAVTAAPPAPRPSESPQPHGPKIPRWGRIVLGLVLAAVAVAVPQESTVVPWPNTTVMTIGLLVIPVILIVWGLAAKNQRSFVPTGAGLFLIDLALGWMMNRHLSENKAFWILIVVVLGVATLLIRLNARDRARAAAAVVADQATSD